MSPPWQLIATSLPKRLRLPTGPPWWPDKQFERQECEPEQAARYEADAWEDPIGGYLVTADSVTVGTVAVNALGFATGATSELPISGASPPSSPLAGSGRREVPPVNGIGRGRKHPDALTH